MAGPAVLPLAIFMCSGNASNAASSLCAAHRQNNEAASQWKGRVMNFLVVTMAVVSLNQISDQAICCVAFVGHF